MVELERKNKNDKALKYIQSIYWSLAFSFVYLQRFDAREYKSRKSKFHFFQEKQKMNSFA